MSNDDQQLGTEEEDKPKSTIIIPQKVMKSPLDVVNTYPSKFQNGTFKAHNPPPSDNEESDNEDSDSHSMRKYSSSSSPSSKHRNSSQHHNNHNKGKKSKYNSKKLQELKRQVTQAKAEVAVHKTKYDVIVLKVNEMITHSVSAYSKCEHQLESDEILTDNLGLFQATYLAQKEDYAQYITPSSNSPAPKSAQESVMQAEFLVEKTLEIFFSNLEKTNSDTALIPRYHQNEITLREQQLQVNQKKLDDELIKGFSQSSFSDASESAVTEEDRVLDNDSVREEVDLLKITVDNLSKQVEAYRTKQANADLYEAKIEELTLIISSNPSLNSTIDQLQPAILERHTLQSRVEKLEKRTKAFLIENNELKSSLNVFHLETQKLEKQIELERKNNLLLNACLSEGDIASQFEDDDERLILIQKLSSHIEQQKQEIAGLQTEVETLTQKIETTSQEKQFSKNSNEPNSKEMDQMEEDFNKAEAARQDQLNIKFIQAKTTILDERQKIETELSEILEKLSKVQEEKEVIKRKNDNLLSENSSFMAIYQTVEKQFKDALAQNDKLQRKQAQYEDKESRIKELETQSEDLQEQLKQMEVLKKQNSEFLIEIEQTRNSNAAIESQLADSKRQIELQQQQHLELQQQVSLKRLDDSSCVDLQDKRDSLTDLEKLTEEIESLKKQKQEIELQKISFQNENSNFRLTYKKIEKQLRKSIKEREALKKELESEKQTNAGLVSGDQASVFTTLRQDLVNITEERDELSKKLNKLENKLKQAVQEANMSKMEKEFDSSVEERIEQAKSQIIEEKILIEAEKEEISKQLDETVKENKLIQVKSEAILNENQAFHSNLNSIQKQLKYTIKEKDALTQQKLELKAELDSKEALIASLNETIRNGSTSSSTSEQSSNQLQERITNLEEQLQLQAKETERLKQELANAEAQNQINQLEEDFDRQNSNGSGANLNQKVDELVKQKSRVELEVSNVKDTYKTMEKEFRKSIKANDEIRHKLTESENRVKELEEKLSLLEQNISEPPTHPVETNELDDELKLENKALRIEVNILKKQLETLESEANEHHFYRSETEESHESSKGDLKSSQSLTGGSSTDLTQKINDLEEIVKSSTIKSNGLNSVIKSLDKELRRQVKENEESKKKIKKIENQLSRKQDLIRQYRLELNITEPIENTDEEDENSNDRTQNQSRSGATTATHPTAQFKELQSRYDALVKDFSDLQQELQLQKLEHEQATGQIQKTKTEIELIEQEKQDLERKANSLSQETSGSQKFYNSLEKEFKKSLKQIDHLTKENEHLNTFKTFLVELTKKIIINTNVQLDEEESEIEYLNRVDIFANPHVSQQFNQDLETRIQELTEQLKEREQEIQEEKLRTEEALLAASNAPKNDPSLMQEIERLREENKEQQASIQREKQQQEVLMKNLRSTITDDRAKVEGLKVELRELKAQNTQLEAARQKEAKLAEEKSAEAERLQIHIQEKSTKMIEKESKIKELHSELDRMNEEIRNQQNSLNSIISVRQSESQKDSQIEDLKSEIEELKLENRIVEQYKQQAEMLKKKSEILEATLLEITQKKDILSQKLKAKDEKSAQDLESLRQTNELLASQNETLKNDRIGMIEELETLIQQQDLDLQPAAAAPSSQQTLSKASSPSVVTPSLTHKPIPVSDFTDVRQAKIKEKIQEYHSKALSQERQQQQHQQPQNPEDHDEFQAQAQPDHSHQDENENDFEPEEDSQVNEENNTTKLAKIEENFRSEVDSLKAIIKSKEQEISRLRVKELSASSSHVTPREKKQNKPTTTHHPHQSSSASSITIDPLKIAQSRISSTKQTNLPANPPKKLNDRSRKSMPQILNNIGVDATALMAAYQTENGFHSSQLHTPVNTTSAILNSAGTLNQNNNTSSSSSLLGAGFGFSAGTTNPSNGHSSPSAQFLDQMYLKCLERSKNLLHKNENLIKSLKTNTSKSQSQHAHLNLNTASSILSNQAQIQANQNQLNHVLMSPTSPTPFSIQHAPTHTQQQQSTPFISPSASTSSIKNPQFLPENLLPQSLQIKQAHSPNEHYFNTKTFNLSNHNSTPIQPYATQKRAQTTTTSPVLSAIAQQSHQQTGATPFKLDYMKLISNQIDPNSSDLPHSQPQASNGFKKQKHQSHSGGFNVQTAAQAQVTSDQKTNSNSSSISSHTQQQQQQHSRYEGERHNSLRQGKGCQFYPNGDTYQGEWKQDKRHGYGVLKDEFKIDIYNGEWENDAYSGQGRLRNRFMQFSNAAFDYRNFETLSKSWQFYSGDFKNNVMHGNGTLILPNSDKFIGSFVEGKVHGQGTYYSANGEVIQGVWQNSRLLSKPSSRF